MDEIEAREQLCALNEFFGIYVREHWFSAADICRMHKIWLGEVYVWAGQYRQVNASKGDFTVKLSVYVLYRRELWPRQCGTLYCTGGDDSSSQKFIPSSPISQVDICRY